LTHIIRRTDGEEVYDEYAFMACDGPDDWTVADDQDFDKPTEYQILRCVPVATRTFGATDIEDRADALDLARRAVAADALDAGGTP
jgi:hypothetical protein